MLAAICTILFLNPFGLSGRRCPLGGGGGPGILFITVTFLSFDTKNMVISIKVNEISGLAESVLLLCKACAQEYDSLRRYTDEEEHPEVIA